MHNGRRWRGWLTIRSASALRFSKGCSSLNLDLMMAAVDRVFVVGCVCSYVEVGVVVESVVLMKRRASKEVDRLVTPRCLEQALT